MVEMGHTIGMEYPESAGTGGGIDLEIDPRKNPKEFWNQPPEILVPFIRSHREELGPIWDPRPIKISLGREPDPNIPFQGIVHEQLMRRLVNDRLGNKFTGGIPSKDTSADLLPDMAIIYGDGTHDQIIRPWEIARKYPTPRPLFFVIDIAQNMRELANFWDARAHLVRKGGNNGAIFGADKSGRHLDSVILSNMQGNWIFLTGDEDKMWNEVVKNILSHNAMTPVTSRMNIQQSESWFTWEEWSQSQIGGDITEAARIMGTRLYGDKPLIADKVDLKGYADALQEDFILKTMGRTETGIGESMRAGVDANLRLLWATISGGGKVNIDPNPDARQFGPVGYITPDGYALVEPKNSKYKISDWSNTSVETRLAALLVRAGAELQSGRTDIKTYHQFTNWLNDELRRHNGRVEVLPQGLKPKFIHLDHIHHKVVDFNPNRVEKVQADPSRFPPGQDGACGYDSTMYAVLDAAFRSTTFTAPGPNEDPLRGKIIAIEEPGHGTTFLAGSREGLTDALYDTSAMVLDEPWTGHKHV